MIYVESTAVLSDDKLYRYLLRRVWDTTKPRMLYVMLNPSTADAEADDATIRSCVRLAATLDYGSIEVVNIFAWRATNPKDLTDLDDPVGPRNYSTFVSAVRRCNVVVCAWGAHAMAQVRSVYVVQYMEWRRPGARCFGKTKSGAPKHPLYIKGGTPLEAFP